MKIFTCKKTLAAVVLSCLFSTAYAQKSLTVTTEAGKLSEKIPEADRYNVTELKISGSINGTDILLLRKMAGKGLEANAETNGKLSSLDISEAKIVAGGDNYFAIKRGLSSQYYKLTEDDVVAPYMFNGLKKLIKLKLPAGTKKIEKYAMSGCTDLTECAIPQQVTAIREYAFTQCRKLASLTLPNTVAELGTAAFKECDGLQSVTFTDGISITSIAKDLFAKNVSLTAITFPESVKEIGESAFAGCKSLASATFPSLLEKIGAHAFENCTSLATLSEFPASLSSIEDKAFYNTVVTAFNVSADNEDYLSKDGVLYAGGGISLELYPTGNTSISFEVPKGVADIGENAFAYAKNLKTIKLPEGVTTIGESAFAFSGLTQLTILGSGMSIKKSAFSNCSELESVDFKGAVSGIDEYAFQNTKKLSAVYFAGTGIPEFKKYVFTPKAVKLKIYVQKELVEKYKDALSKSNAILGSNFEVLDNTTTGVGSPSLDRTATEEARYTISGHRISTPTKGINIIKLSNGKVIKRIEK